VTPPEPDSFLSGESGTVAGVRSRALRRAADLALDVRGRLARTGRALDELAAATPPRELVAMCVYRPGSRRIPSLVRELQRTGHDLRLALGATGEPPPELARFTVAAGLGGGKFQNLNRVFAALGHAEPPDWTLVVDDDVVLPHRFLDRFLALCERFDLALAQPAQTLASHAAWQVTRRRAGSLVRETRFVEIGPVTAFRREAAAELLPFPDLRFGWGLDAHWAAVAAERGWRVGVVDAVPVRHAEAPVATGYSREEAIDEARRFLADRPYLPSEEAQRTVATHSEI
jgi:glycosyl transferase family 2